MYFTATHIHQGSQNFGKGLVTCFAYYATKITGDSKFH